MATFVFRGWVLHFPQAHKHTSTQLHTDKHTTTHPQTAQPFWQLTRARPFKCSKQQFHTWNYAKIYKILVSMPRNHYFCNYPSTFTRWNATLRQNNVTLSPKGIERWDNKTFHQSIISNGISKHHTNVSSKHHVGIHQRAEDFTKRLQWALHNTNKLTYHPYPQALLWKKCSAHLHSWPHSAQVMHKNTL